MARSFEFCGLKFEVKMVAVANIVVDKGYQRPRSASFEKEIAKIFRPECFDLPLVCERADGTLTVPDGQTRIAVCELKGERFFPARVIQSEGRAHEAEIFSIINQYKRQLTSLHLHNAKVVAQDDESIDIKETVEGCGFFISSTKAWPNIGCVEKLKSLNRMGVLSRSLNTIKAAWPGDKTALHETLIAGLGLFLGEFSDADQERLVKVCRKIKPDNLMAEAYAAKGVSGGRYKAVSKILAGHYNTRLRSAKKLAGEAA